MWNYLTEQFESPLILVDIGASHGIDPRWNALGDSLKAYCFDADKDECDKLNSLGRHTFIPEALGASKGRQTLYKTHLPLSSGLYKTNMAFFDRFMNKDNGRVVGTEEIDVISFDDARLTYNIPRPDFIKLDVEGAELDILKGSTLDDTFGIFSEFRFHKQINGCPVFSELDQFLVSKGFMLYGIWTGKYARNHYSQAQKFMMNGITYIGGSSGGQVMDGDALYFRDAIQMKLTRDQFLKAVCMYLIFDLKDCAAELIGKGQHFIDVDYCLKLL